MDAIYTMQHWTGTGTVNARLMEVKEEPELLRIAIVVTGDGEQRLYNKYWEEVFAWLFEPLAKTYIKRYNIIYPDLLNMSYYPVEFTDKQKKIADVLNIKEAGVYIATFYKEAKNGL